MAQTKVCRLGDKLWFVPQKAVRSDGIEVRNTIRGGQLGRGKEIKAERGSKGGWQSVKRDDQLGSVRGTDIAHQTLVPGETPMRALSSGQHLFSGCKGFRWRGLGGAFQADGLAANNLELGPPDATAWPVEPQHRCRR